MEAYGQDPITVTPGHHISDYCPQSADCGGTTMYVRERADELMIVGDLMCAKAEQGCAVMDRRLPMRAAEDDEPVFPAVMIKNPAFRQHVIPMFEDVRTADGRL